MIGDIYKLKTLDEILQDEQIVYKNEDEKYLYVRFKDQDHVIPKKFIGQEILEISENYRDYTESTYILRSDAPNMDMDFFNKRLSGRDKLNVFWFHDEGRGIELFFGKFIYNCLQSPSTKYVVSAYIEDSDNGHNIGRYKCITILETNEQLNKAKLDIHRYEYSLKLIRDKIIHYYIAECYKQPLNSPKDKTRALIDFVFFQKGKNDNTKKICKIIQQCCFFDGEKLSYDQFAIDKFLSDDEDFKLLDWIKSNEQYLINLYNNPPDLYYPNIFMDSDIIKKGFELNPLIGIVAGEKYESKDFQKLSSLVNHSYPMFQIDEIQ